MRKIHCELWRHKGFDITLDKGESKYFYSGYNISKEGTSLWAPTLKQAKDKIDRQADKNGGKE
jgi:hypothetical protein